MSVSQLDNSVKIDNENWAVTLIIGHKSRNHAEIIIEGQKVDEIFTQKVHLVGVFTFTEQERKQQEGCYYFYSKSGDPRIQKMKARKILYRKKTETWAVPSEKVEKMLEQVRKEQHSPPPFSIFGKHSVFSKSSAVDHHEVENKELESLRTDDPVMFKSVLSEATDQSEFRNDTFTKVAAINAYLPIIGIPISLWFLQKKHRWFKYSEEQRSGYVDLAKKHIISHKIHAQNCFTWACDKLNSLDIEVSKIGKIDHLISATSLHVK